MQFKELTPILWTERLDETIEFYVSLLGFSCGEKNYDWGWAALHNGTIELMLAKPNAHTPFSGPRFTGSFYFRMEGVEEFYSKMKDKVRIAYPLETFEWGMKEFAIYDNNGYMLQFGEEFSPR